MAICLRRRSDLGVGFPSGRTTFCCRERTDVLQDCETLSDRDEKRRKRFRICRRKRNRVDEIPHPSRVDHLVFPDPGRKITRSVVVIGTLQPRDHYFSDTIVLLPEASVLKQLASYIPSKLNGAGYTWTLSLPLIGYSLAVFLLNEPIKQHSLSLAHLTPHPN